MGMDYYIVRYECAKIPRGSRFHEELEKEFANYGGNGYLLIDSDQFTEWLNEHPELTEKYPEHIRRIKELLEQEDGQIELDYA